MTGGRGDHFGVFFCADPCRLVLARRIRLAKVQERRRCFRNRSTLVDASTDRPSKSPCPDRHAIAPGCRIKIIYALLCRRVVRRFINPARIENVFL